MPGLIISALSAGNPPLTWQESNAETAYKELITHSLAGDFDVRGFKSHPTVQNFNPSDEQFYLLWAALQNLGLPALCHTGQTGIGSGRPGGFGLKLGLSNQILLDNVAADFPELPIIMARPRVRWQDEALAVATHK